MKTYLCPRKDTCENECPECDFSIAFYKLTKEIDRLKRERAKLKRELAKYEELGTVEELDEALYNATL